jgi:hypothetical protein
MKSRYYQVFNFLLLATYILQIIQKNVARSKFSQYFSVTARYLHVLRRCIGTH